MASRRSRITVKPNLAIRAARKPSNVPSDTENFTPLKDKNDTVNNAENPKPAHTEPHKPAQLEPVTPAQAEPVKPAEVEPVKPVEVEPVKPVQEEPVKLAQAEQANDTDTKQVGPITSGKADTSSTSVGQRRGRIKPQVKIRARVPTTSRPTKTETQGSSAAPAATPSASVTPNVSVTPSASESSTVTNHVTPATNLASVTDNVTSVTNTVTQGDESHTGHEIESEQAHAPAKRGRTKAKPNLMAANENRVGKVTHHPDHHDGAPPTKLARVTSPQPSTSSQGNDESSSEVNFEEAEKLLQSLTQKKARRSVKNLSGPIDSSKVTMRDLIYLNPTCNPMKSTLEESKRKKQTKKESRPEAGDNASIQGDSLPASPVPSAVGGGDDEIVIDSEGEGEPVPQVRIGPDGNIILNEASLVIDNDKDRTTIIDSGIVEEGRDGPYVPSLYYGKKTTAKQWSMKETKKFYMALSTIGTDFSLMANFFEKRTRLELKRKFKREEKQNRNLIEKALKERREFDVALFQDMSDTDGEEEKERKKQDKKEREKEAKEAKKKKQPSTSTPRTGLKRKYTRKKISRLAYNSSSSEDEENAGPKDVYDFSDGPTFTLESFKDKFGHKGLPRNKSSTSAKDNSTQDSEQTQNRLIESSDSEYVEVSSQNSGRKESKLNDQEQISGEKEQVLSASGQNSDEKDRNLSEHLDKPSDDNVVKTDIRPDVVSVKSDDIMDVNTKSDASSVVNSPSADDETKSAKPAPGVTISETADSETGNNENINQENTDETDVQNQVDLPEPNIDLANISGSLTKDKITAGQFVFVTSKSPVHAMERAPPSSAIHVYMVTPGEDKDKESADKCSDGEGESEHDGD